MNTREYNRLLKSIKTLPPSAGFTMVEVLMAAGLTTLVMLIAGTGLVKLLGSNYRANAASEIRNNMERTVEFISDEVRRAEYVADELSKVDSTSKKAIEDKGGKVVLSVRLPEYQDQIIYYTKEAANPWVGPKVLYRYGPLLKTNGEFDNTGATQNADGKYTAAKWSHVALVDMLVGENEVTDRDCDPYRNNETPDNNRANDPPGWKMLPQDGASTDKLDGFFVCAKGQLVMLRLNSRVPLTTKEKLTYNVDTTVYGHSSIPSSSTTISSTTPPPPPPFICTGITCVVTDPTNPPTAVVNSDPTCDSTKKVCWENVPIITSGDYTDKYGVKLQKNTQGQTVLAVNTPLVLSTYGSYPGIQSVEVYTKDTLPKTFDISLSDKQILYVLKFYKNNQIYRDYKVVVTFDGKGNLTINP